MNNTQNMMIVMLLVTAVVLGVLVYGSFAPTAQADVSVKQGDYIMSVGARTRTEDFLYVVDIAARRVNVYAIDENRGTIEMGQQTSIDLERAFTAP